MSVRQDRAGVSCWLGVKRETGEHVKMWSSRGGHRIASRDACRLTATSVLACSSASTPFTSLSTVAPSPLPGFL